LISNLQLFSVGNFEFRLHHLLIIGILAIAFTMSFMVRSQAADYGFELNEFDPFFNYRATQFIVDNGYPAYFNWHDDRSWHPQGRDVAATSQIMLHITAAITYQIFGGNSSLYDFTILFPVVFGSLTVIVIFALVRVIGGTTAGLLAALFFSISVPVIIRGTIGWFKSEPLGLFYGLLGIYLFLSGLKSNNKKIAFIKLIGGGIILGFGLASWGGIQFLVIPLGLFFFALPLLRKDHSFIVWAIPVFASSLLLTAASFERPGIGFVTSIGGFALIGPIVFFVANIVVQKISKEENRIRNGLAFLGGSLITTISVLILNTEFKFLPLPSFRYLNALNPFLTTKDPLVDSVAEHAGTTTAASFFFFSILIIFAGMGVWLLLRNREKLGKYSLKIKSDMIIFALIMGFTGVYISSAFVRLELFASISVIILASIGISILSAEIFKHNKSENKKISKPPKTIIKVSFVVIIVILLILPTTIPSQSNWITSVKAPPTILNGGTVFAIATSDWPDAMEWLKNNTEEDAVIAAWWDYGYWITTLGERISLADNATLSTKRIQKIGEMLLSPPDRAMEILKELDADYVLIYIAAQKIQLEPREIYLLTGGADESKKQWFMRIAEVPLSKYLESDGFSGTKEFWENTLLGKMIPYSLLAYVNLQSNVQSETWNPGFTGIYEKEVKYPIDGDGPLQLAYSSKSFDRKNPGPVSGVFIYEINKDYVSKNPQPSIQETIVDKNEISVISTAHGDITIEFKDDIAPNTVENFKKLANSGFYDRTIFHRIVPEFVIQGGDPNTISGSSDTWGQGDPGYSIEPEFSNEKHRKYILSMARGADINSAGSQFFIMLGDAPWLDGQYTIFGEVISGQEVVDKIASLETNQLDQPVNPEDAKITKIRILEE